MKYLHGFDSGDLHVVLHPEKQHFSEPSHSVSSIHSSIFLLEL